MIVNNAPERPCKGSASYGIFGPNLVTRQGIANVGFTAMALYQSLLGGVFRIGTNVGHKLRDNPF